MLQRMRRETTSEYIVDLLRRIRAGVPGITLRTTFIVGFPGENDTHFETLLDFIRETRFERLGVFTYSREEKTVAGKMERQIPDAIRQERRALAMAEQHDIAREISEGFVGRKIKVIVERRANEDDLQQASISSWEHGLIRDDVDAAPAIKGNYLVARGEADAPDIDGRVYIKTPARKDVLPIGRFAKVKVVGHTDFDLIAEPA
jgi:ribosomal protein S12 methylthiotransferase